MLKKISLYGATALVLSFVLVPAYAQTTEEPPTSPVADVTQAPTAPPAPPTEAPASDNMEALAAEVTSGTDAMADNLSEDSSAPPATKEEAPRPPVNADRPKYYDDHGNPYNTHDYHEIQPDNVLIALQRDPQLPSGHFVLSMVVGNSFVGCTKVLNPKFSTEFDNETMTVKVEKFAIDKRDMPRYPHYECNRAPQQPVARAILSREQLLEHNVKKIKFRTAKATVTYNVKMTDQYIQLISDSRLPPDRNRFRPLEVDGVSNTLKLWFYPDNTVILSADGTSKDVTMERKLTELARNKGLTPLAEIYPDHAHFRKRADYYYFVDQQGRYKVGDSELFDYVQADAMKFGLEADEPIKKNVAVFIRKPGQYD